MKKEDGVYCGDGRIKKKTDKLYCSCRQVAITTVFRICDDEQMLEGRLCIDCLCDTATSLSHTVHQLEMANASEETTAVVRNQDGAVK